MLVITVQGVEGWDEQKEEFVSAKPPVCLQLEHSLISLAKWESKWEKPFLSKEQKTVEETIDYIRCMTLNSNVPADVYDRLSSQNFRDVHAYIDGAVELGSNGAVRIQANDGDIFLKAGAATIQLHGDTGKVTISNLEAGAVFG